MGCFHSTPSKDEDDHGEAPIDIRFSNTSIDGKERNTRPSARPVRFRNSSEFAGGPSPNFGARHASSRGVPSPSLSSVSLVPVARTGSYDVRVASTRARPNGAEGVIETSRLVVDHLKGNVFINQYLIIKDLGKGAHGTVKLVYNTQDELLYAMKVIHKRRIRRQSYLAEPRAVAHMMRNIGASPLSHSHTEGHRGSPLASPRTPNSMTDEYSNEIAVMKELDHPNVVKLYEVIHDPSNNKLLMTMEYVEGGCVLAGNSPTQKVPIPEATAVKYFRDVVKGLEYLHFNRIVHGDLKPDNLLMSSSGKVKISDFGSARFCEKSDMIFATAGTPSFMAPEMCQGKQFNGFPGDIWALGVCLFMFVFGRPPFTGGTTFQIYEAIQSGELAFPPTIPVSTELQDLLRSLLRKDPGDRISLEEIPTHPWVTRGGALPVLQTSNERAVQRVFEAMRKRNESGARRATPSTVPLAAPPEPVDMRKLVPDAEVREFNDGDIIIAQGQMPEGLYYVQDGFVDMLLMPSEKKLVADEDFADAIDDEEDEDDEAVVTATANVLEGRRSGTSGVGGDGDDGSGGEELGEEAEEEADQRGMDDFMALFGSRLSDRVSPLGSSRTGTPRNQSACVTPRMGSQTVSQRNHSTLVSPRQGSHSLAVRRSAGSKTYCGSPGGMSPGSPHFGRGVHVGHGPHHLRVSSASAANGGPMHLGSGQSLPQPFHHLPQHLAHLAPLSPSGSPSHNASRTPSQSTPAHSTPLIGSHGGGGGTGASTTLPSRHNSQTASPRHGGTGGGNNQPSHPLASLAARMSLNGASQLRQPSYTGAGMNASITPSPLGLSCSLAADSLGHGDASRGAADSRLGHGTSKPPELTHCRSRDTPQSPFLVPSPNTSPRASGTASRKLAHEPSFNPRNARPEPATGVVRQPSRLSSMEPGSTPAPAVVQSGRKALLNRAASNRARSSSEFDESADHHSPRVPAQGAAAAHESGPSSRRSASLLGPRGTSASPIAAPAAKKQDSDGLDLLVLSPTESRRLSVTAGGAASFKHLGGAGVVVAAAAVAGGSGFSSAAAVAAAAAALGGTGSVSPGSSLSRVHSTEAPSRPPAAVLSVAAETYLSDGGSYDGGSHKAASNDSIISNADISMQASARGGWRRERPAPLQISNSTVPGSADAGHGAGTNAGGADGHSSAHAQLHSSSPLHRDLHEGPRRVPTGDPHSTPSGRSLGRGPIGLSRTGRSLANGARIESPGEQAGGDVEVEEMGVDSDRASAPGEVAGQDADNFPLHEHMSAQPLNRFRTVSEQPIRHRERRHSTSSYNATSMLTRILGVSSGGAPLDRSSIQEWSTTSKLAQKAIQRSDSMHSRMAQMVLRAKQHAVRRKRRGSMQLITTRGPGSVVGELSIDGKPAPSPSTVVAKGCVTILLIKNEKVNKYRNQPSVMAALHRSQNASLVQEAMERFVECEQEVLAVEVIRRTITTEPNMHMDMPTEDTMSGPPSSERLMADIYNA